MSVEARCRNPHHPEVFPQDARHRATPLVFQKDSGDRSNACPDIRRIACRRRPAFAGTGQSRSRQDLARARLDSCARHRFRRFLFPAFLLRKLEPRRGHRQGRHVQHRPRCRRAGGERRQAGVRLLRRHFARGARRGVERRARDRPPGTIGVHAAEPHRRIACRSIRRPTRYKASPTRRRSAC